MALEIIGKLAHKYDTQVVSDTFSKREFVLDISEEVNGKAYPNFAKMQVTQARCAVLDSYNLGEEVRISFNIRGNKATTKDNKSVVYTNLDAWKIERVGAQQQAPQQAQYQQPQNNYQQFQQGNEASLDQLPF